MENMIAVKSMTMLNSLDLTMPKANGAVTGLGRQLFLGSTIGKEGRQEVVEGKLLSWLNI